MWQHLKSWKIRGKKKMKEKEKGVGSSTEERNDGERNNGIPEAGRKQIFDGCPKEKRN